ncbi:MAG: hypothetical protein U5K74_01410 [Gemmatimonadaceae bacterium]|nr:hypothetical protein [Gemmatimonadaceae bacterium]
MNDPIPFRSRHPLQWQIVLVNPKLLKAAQRRLGCAGPSHTIEEALRLALGRTRHRPSERRKPVVIH